VNGKSLRSPGIREHVHGMPLCSEKKCITSPIKLGNFSKRKFIQRPNKYGHENYKKALRKNIRESK